jgi:AdoMet-dependent heme synthase
MKLKFDQNKSPWTTIWEITQACDVVCLDYGDGIQSELDPLELSTQEAEQMIREIAELPPRIFMFSGADPLKREDIYDLVEYAALRHLHPVMAVRATPLLTFKAVARLKQAGLSRMVFRLDGSTPELHDVICAVHGSYARTLEATQWAEECRLPFQITTQVCQRNLDDLERLAVMLKPFRVSQWNVEFVVPKREAQMEEMPSPRQFEDAFARLYKLAQNVPFKVKTSEAPHYRRYVLQQQAAARARGPMQPPQFEEGIPGILPVNEERAVIFISDTGEVYPGASLPLTAGNVRIQKLAEIYRGAQILNSLRDVSSLRGKCGFCAFKQVCGGSRARACAVNGNPFAEDPACVYRPLPPQRVRAVSPAFRPPRKAVVEPQD